MKKAFVIYNPSAGREKLVRDLPFVLDLLHNEGYKVSSYGTEKESSTALAAARAAAQGADLVVVAGGDGTIHEVVNGLAPLASRPVLGLIPAGTSNDFARALGIPASVKQAARVLISGKEIPVDAGKVRETYFINIAAAGALTDITYATPVRLKTLWGRGAYYLKGISKIPDIRSFGVRIEYDDLIFSGDVMLLMIANSCSVAGFANLLPRASYQDGLFDLLIVKKMRRWAMLRLVCMLFSGRHLCHPQVLYLQGRRINVDVKAKLNFNLDGEYGGTLPAEFINLHHHFRFMVPGEAGRGKERDPH